MAEGPQRRIRGHLEEMRSLRDVAQEAAIAAVAILRMEGHGGHGDGSLVKGKDGGD